MLTTLVLAPFLSLGPQTQYDYVQLTGQAGVGLSRVFDVNDAGVVAGSVMTAQGERAALWTMSGGIEVLVGVNASSVATSVNERRQVSGSFINPTSSVSSADRGFLWDAGTVTVFEPTGVTEVTAGVDIAEDGRILISSGFAGGGPDRTLIARALVGGPNGLGPVLPFTRPTSISAGGVVAGGDALNLDGQSFPLSGFLIGDDLNPRAANDLLVAAGFISRSAGGFSSETIPIIWDSSQQPSVIPVMNANGIGRATDINNRGQVVGREDNGAFLYEMGSSPVLLSSVTVGVPAGVRLREATDINEAGQILGISDDGSFFNEERFLLVPSLQIGEPFCTPEVNSLGRTASLTAIGSASVADNTLELEVTDAPDGFGLFFSSRTFTSSVALGDGSLCLGGALQRIFPPVQVQRGIGRASIDLVFLNVVPGETLGFQFWHRDITLGGAGFNLSQGVEISFQ